MKKSTLSILLLMFGFGIIQTKAQTTSSSSNLMVQPVADRTVLFSVTDAGVSKPIIWGLDLAWLSEENIRRGVGFMGGTDKVDIVRSSFTPTAALVNGDLPAAELSTLNTRLNIIKKWLGSNTKVILNCDHPTVAASYLGNAANWAQLIDVTTRRHQEAGRTVISVSPFNEPDFGWGQYTGSNGQSDFNKIALELRKNSRFDSIRIAGGNTLNCDQALPWYNYLKANLDEGNTHQLAGSFDNFANFYQTVRANGDHATGDELHNVMEAMVGSEYGMQTGIWWGTAEYARGEFVKTSDGQRLAYAEHRPNWTAASVYRGTDGKVQAFGGTSERQAVTTTYRFVSKDRDVYYDGYGPQREYSMVLPGGTGYQTGQTNAERVVNISWGDDIQPAIKGKYMLVNRMSSKVMEVSAGATTAGANVRQWSNTGAAYQQWNVTPVDSRIGGDYSYFTFTAVHSAKAMDILNYSLDNGGNIIVWDDGKSGNQQWYLEYAEDGWFYIRSRHSSKCLEVASPYTTNGANVQQSAKTGGLNQQWRFLPVGTTIEFVAPTAPQQLVATANAESVRLDWTATPDADLAGYNIFRSTTAGGPYSTIARNVTTTSFVDNTVTAGIPYYYTLKAVDAALNRSAYSNEVTATGSGTNDLVAHLQFENNIQDSTINLNHGATVGSVTYTDGKQGKAIVLNGTDACIQLPANVLNHSEITISSWVYWKGISVWQRIFDFGNDQTQYMFLTPRNSAGKLCFGIKNGGSEQLLTAPMLAMAKWSHVAVTMSAAGVSMYVNGALVAESKTITIRPNDIKPISNYIGRSQFSDPLFNGNIDDFRVYNYALSANEVAQLSAENPNAVTTPESRGEISVWPSPASDILHINYTTEKGVYPTTLSVYNMDGRLVLSKESNLPNNEELNVSGIPAGMYMLRITNNTESFIKKILVVH